MVDGRSDFAGGRVDQAEAHVARRVLDAVEITGDASVWSKQHDAAGVGEEIVFFIEGVAEIGSGGYCVDGFFFSSQKMPARGSFRAGEAR